MKKLLLIFALGAFAFSVNAQDVVLANAGKAAFNWTNAKTYDFGNLKKGTPATHVFRFTNSGSEPLIISKASGSCGCTVASYTKEPIPVGGSGEVAVTYDAAKAGAFQKSITLHSNSGVNPVILYVKGEVTE